MPRVERRRDGETNGGVESLEVPVLLLSDDPGFLAVPTVEAGVFKVPGSPESLPDGLLAHLDDVRWNLLAGAPLRVEVLTGPRPSSLAPIVTIHDEHSRELLLLGAEGGTSCIASGLERRPEAWMRRASGSPKPFDGWSRERERS